MLSPCPNEGLPGPRTTDLGHCPAEISIFSRFSPAHWPRRPVSNTWRSDKFIFLFFRNVFGTVITKSKLGTNRCERAKVIGINRRSCEGGGDILTCCRMFYLLLLLPGRKT